LRDRQQLPSQRILASAKSRPRHRGPLFRRRRHPPRRRVAASRLKRQNRRRTRGGRFGHRPLSLRERAGVRVLAKRRTNRKLEPPNPVPKGEGTKPQLSPPSSV